jgi:hypothetical protein
MSSARNTVVAGFNCRTAITQPGDAIISYRINSMRACFDVRGDSEPFRVARPSGVGEWMRMARCHGFSSDVSDPSPVQLPDL